MIDDVSTIIDHVKGNVAKGKIFMNDFTFKPCYVVKGQNMFAHGETIKEARQALEEKIFSQLDAEERIEAFLEEFNTKDKYLATKFFDWHNKLTGSCEMGRRAFATNHDIDLEKDEFTVKEFIDLTINDFGSEVIKMLKERVGN